MVKKTRFPTFWAIVLLMGIAWFLGELGYLNINIPWLPTILIVVAIGAIVNNYSS
ncbi:MAG: hypothetical protein ACE5ES_01950 [Candidatus Nanoarchaeia archaeon]